MARQNNSNKQQAKSLGKGRGKRGREESESSEESDSSEASSSSEESSSAEEASVVELSDEDDTADFAAWKINNDQYLQFLKERECSKIYYLYQFIPSHHRFNYYHIR